LTEISRKITENPNLFLIGDNPNGREYVMIEPGTKPPKKNK